MKDLIIDCFACVVGRIRRNWKGVLIWNNVAERANSTAQTITASGMHK